MARGKRNGILIAGGGLAGCLAALALARHRPDVPFLIVEEDETFGGEAYRLFADADLHGDARDLLEPVVTNRWPGFYTVFPGFSRKLKAEQSGFAAADLHAHMMETLTEKQYRLGTRVVAVREDALVLDGGEELKAEGAIDARGAASLSTLDLFYEASFERDYRFKAPHRVDRPVLIDATGDQTGGLRLMRCIPVAEDRLILADVSLSERAQPDEAAGARLDAYAKARGWQKKAILGERATSRPLPIGGDFAAFWRLGGHRVAKLGLRGGFVHPLTGTTVADAAEMALLLAGQRDFSGEALHDLFAAEARALWKRREPLRAVTAAFAATPAEQRRALAESLARLDAATISRLRADRLGMLDRLRVQKALKGG
ncbi:MAG TPA: lycopene beta-cyclase CrtY [Allosphingosinicella sp.]|nr:lycopene beta-cyclase CrtY [Allosphingosinicella sp.]